MSANKINQFSSINHDIHPNFLFQSDAILIVHVHNHLHLHLNRLTMTKICLLVEIQPH